MLKAKIELQERQISKLTCIIDNLEEKNAKCERLLDANIQLNKRIEELTSNNKQRVREQKVFESVKKIFNKSQMRLLENSNLKYCNWSVEDLEDAKELCDCSPKAYNFLRKKGYPLPTEVTMKKNLKKLKAENSKKDKADSADEQDVSGEEQTLIEICKNVEITYENSFMEDINGEDVEVQEEVVMDFESEPEIKDESTEENMFEVSG